MPTLRSFPWRNACSAASSLIARMQLSCACCRRSSCKRNTLICLSRHSTQCSVLGKRSANPLNGAKPPMRVTKAATKIAVSPAQAAVQLSLRTTDFVSMADLSPRETATVLDLAALLKAKPKEFRDALTGKQLVLIFEKPSLRTRVTFEAGMAALGGTSLFMDQRGSRISSREEVRDVARNLERWVDGIVLRTYDHATITEMAEHAGIPVINALSDLEHPCQALADFLTLKEKFGDLSSAKLAYVGDGNNVAHPLMLAAALLGSSITIATPAGFEPALQIVLEASEIARKTGAHIELSHDPVAAVCGADAIYT